MFPRLLGYTLALRTRRKKAKKEYGLAPSSVKQGDWDLHLFYTNGVMHKYDIHSNVRFEPLWSLACRTLKETITTMLSVGLGLWHNIQDNLECTWHADYMMNQHCFVYLLRQAVISLKTKTVFLWAQRYTTAAKYHWAPNSQHAAEIKQEWGPPCLFPSQNILQLRDNEKEENPFFLCPTRNFRHARCIKLTRWRKLSRPAGYVHRSWNVQRIQNKYLKRFNCKWKMATLWSL